MDPMTDPDRTPLDPALGAEGEQGASVFGSLPRTRPAVRSPRRAEATAESAEPEPEAPGSRGREADVEALARAGVSFAGEAATLGFRIAGRAAAALRNAVERR
jgi:hypothetical protein